MYRFVYSWQPGCVDLNFYPTHTYTKSTFSSTIYTVTIINRLPSWHRRSLKLAGVVYGVCNYVL